MCGIAGIWRSAGGADDGLERLERMAAVLRHRGPDDAGFLLAGGGRSRCYRGGRPARPDLAFEIGLASRRLAITDPSPAGCQPIANESEDVFVVFNGAIHNFPELREELEARGHRFRSRSDTEVVVHAYEEWGEACAERFNGMWAYAIWDQRCRRLVCSRDRFGIKPLYLAWTPEAFWFASEAKAILAGRGERATPDLHHLRRLLGSPERAASLDLEGRRTPFAGIELLEPATNLVLSAEGCERTCYWRYEGEARPLDATVERDFRELFLDALRIRLRSDVGISLLLSGGLDSSTIAVGLRHLSASDRPALTAVFPGFERDEHARAQRISERTGLRLQTVEYDPRRLFADLDAVTWHLDAPPALSQTLPRWQLLEAAAARTAVVLEGQGADELLAGYPERYLLPYLRSELGELRLHNLASRLGRLAAATTRLDRSLGPPPLALLRRVAVRLRPPVEVLSRELAELPVADERDARWQGRGFASPLDAALVRDHARDMLPHLLHLGDAISMGHSVESRLPFLDHRLVELVLGLPFDAKMRGGVTKHLLRRAFAAELPPETVGDRFKIGFATPLASWLSPRLDSEVKPILLSARQRERGIFDMQGLSRLLARIGDPESTLLLFRCLAVARWFDLFVDGEGPTGRPAR